ncbi:MAG: hypothetical protein LQ352_000250 [Teloschistes flavicans]|nr:MAG: hypothetical protein LQ352_000250 [Teloschistes flavicans]
MNNQAAPAGGDNRDYLDKDQSVSEVSPLALDSAQSKIPGKAGERFRGPGASEKNRAMNEKITDFLRKQFEKLTG